MNHDYSEYEENNVSESNTLGALRDLALEQRNAELQIIELEEKLSEAKEELRQISEIRLPELMDELGIPSFQTKDGLKISIKETIRTSMGRSDNEKIDALDWLESNGHGALIKRVVEIPFNRGQDKEALQLRDELQTKGKKAVFQRKVEPSTLRAFITEQLESGVDIPLDIFKVLRERRSKIELPSHG